MPNEWCMSMSARSVQEYIFTLCAYAQQGYVFGRVGLCMYVCMYGMYVCIVWTKKRAVWGLTTEKFPVSVIYCSLVEFDGQKGAYYARRFVLGMSLGKKFGTILLMDGKRVLENCIMVSYALSTCNAAMQCYS